MGSGISPYFWGLKISRINFRDLEQEKFHICDPSELTSKGFDLGVE